MTVSFVGALALVGTLALVGSNSSGASPLATAPAAAPAPAATELTDLDEPMVPGLPSEHSPAAHAHGAPADPSGTDVTDLEAPKDPPAIAWKAPPAWKTAPNPSALRIATYKVSHAPTDAEDADVSVVRAGGTADANIERWRDQFDGSVKETRTVKTVRGLKVTLVEISGTYLGGAGGAVTSRKGWTLVAAIVETPQLPYFFKLTGATTTVRSARPAFDALVESISGS